MKVSTYSLLFFIVTAKDFKLYQMDVKFADLNGELEGDIFIEQAEGRIDQSHSELVSKFL